MITFKALGRNGNTGNAMFQYAATLSIAKDKGFDVKFPHHESYFDVNYGSMNRSIFEGFDIKVPVATEAELNQITNTYNEPGFNYSPDILSITDNTNLMGYFQNEKYFVHNRDYILQNLQFNEGVRDSAKFLFENIKIDPAETTSIHVRRADFVVKQSFHPLLGPEYYANASSHCRTKYYLVFSDDIAWCVEAFGANRSVKFSVNKDPFIDMCAMSMCKNHIIANSTFGWWAAWLNPNPDKIVVAPKKWFGPAYDSWDSSGVVPESWLKA